MDPDQYCREIEAHLCRRNAGHLVRLVGPAFEMVVGWSGAGIPLRVACAGIDRYIERYEARGGSRRRPLRAEFCEADVLDAFDQWRRAVGVGTAGGRGGPAAAAAEQEGDGPPGESSRSRAGHSLRAHLDRLATRLTDRLAAGGLPSALEEHIDGLLRELARQREASRTLRGEARQQLIARLEELDAALLAAARSASDAEALAAARKQAENELQDFRPRMAAADYGHALERAASALLRERWRLPSIGY